MILTEGSKGSEGKKMHPDFERADKLSHIVIGAAMEVHSLMGPGLIESIYEKCLMRELELRGIPVRRQEKVEIEYKGFTFEETLRFDLLVDECLLVEGKAAEKIVPVNKAQLMSYIKLLNSPLGLIFNFHEEHLRDGIVRLILPRAGRSRCCSGFKEILTEGSKRSEGEREVGRLAQVNLDVGSLPDFHSF